MRREKRAEQTFKEKTIENFPNQIIKMNIQIQEA